MKALFFKRNNKHENKTMHILSGNSDLKYRKSRNIYLVLVLTFSIFLNACLKDDEHYWDYSNASSVIELPEVPTDGLVIRAIEIVPKVDIKITVSLASPNTSNTDITVKLALDSQVAIDTLNAQKQRAADAAGESFTPYEYLPDSVYSISNFNVTIPAGKRTTELVVSVNSEKISLTKNYVLPVKIAQIPDGYVLPSNFSSQIVKVVLKNKYDGVYELTGTLVDHVNSSLTAYSPNTIQLITTGANQVKVYDNTISGIGHTITSGTALSYYGSFGLLVNFDASGSGTITSVVNYYGQPASNTRSAKLDPSGVNTWDSATKTIKIKYFMIQTNQATGSNSEIKKF